MLGQITTVARVVAPHAKTALVAGSKGIAAMAVATKATNYARDRAQELVDSVENARLETRAARADRHVIPTQEKVA